MLSVKDSNSNVGIVKGLSDADLLALNNANTTLATLSSWGGAFITSSTEPDSAEDGKVWVQPRIKDTVTFDSINTIYGGTETGRYAYPIYDGYRVTLIGDIVSSKALAFFEGDTLETVFLNIKGARNFNSTMYRYTDDTKQVQFIENYSDSTCEYTSKLYMKSVSLSTKAHIHYSISMEVDTHSLYDTFMILFKGNIYTYNENGVLIYQNYTE